MQVSVLNWDRPERMQRGAFENNMKQESMQYLTGYMHPEEAKKGRAMGFSVLRLGDQIKDDINRDREIWATGVKCGLGCWMRKGGG